MAFPLLQVGFFAVAASMIWLVHRRLFRKSSIDHLPGPKETSPLLGGFSGFVSKNAWDFMDDLAEGYGGVAKLRDVFGEKMLYVTDPLAVHSILIKDQNLYEEPPDFSIGCGLLIGPSILSARGQVHRRHRKVLYPIFSTANMRKLAPIFASVSATFRDAVSGQIQHGPRDIDLSKWCSRVVLEITGQAIVDYPFDPLVEDKMSDYARAIKQSFPSLFTIPFHFFAALMWTKYFGVSSISRWVVNHYPSKKVQDVNHTWDYIWDQAAQLVKEKKAAPADQSDELSGKDLLSVIVKANTSARAEEKLSDEEIIATVNAVIYAAVETTPNMTSRILHVLALHPEVQEKLRQELVVAWDDGDEIPYDRLMELPFLDAVYRETLRLYPPVLQTNRVALDDTVLPLSYPITDTNGQAVDGIALEKGQTVIVGIHGCNRRTAIWGDDATEWKPERWFAPLPEKVKSVQNGSVIGNHILSYVGGSRSCIGFKFAEMAIKTILCHIIPTLKISPGEKEIVWITSRVIIPTTEQSSSSPWVEPEAAMPLRVESVKPTLVVA